MYLYSRAAFLGWLSRISRINVADGISKFIIILNKNILLHCSFLLKNCKFPESLPLEYNSPYSVVTSKLSWEDFYLELLIPAFTRLFLAISMWDQLLPQKYEHCGLQSLSIFNVPKLSSYVHFSNLNLNALLPSSILTVFVVSPSMFWI